MRTMTAFIRRSPEACWSVLTDPSTFTGWVPGLRRTRVIAIDEAKRPREVQFEFAASRTYTLVYSYAADKHEMHWEPRLGKRDAVFGFARVESSENGTNLTYGLKPGGARSAAEIALDDLGAVVTAFVHWMHDDR
jgi:uncharacterized protein YndB with AHSA1/START domain